MLTLETFRQLQTPSGVQALAAAAALHSTDATLLRDLEMLRKHFPPDLASAALDTIRLRARAGAKFSRADQMFFTAEALEQASGEAVAHHRAARYTRYGSEVYDICCSIGSDALALAEAGLTVHGVDRDPLRVALAEANAAACNVADRATFAVADALTFALPDGALVFFDPARRRDGRRQRAPERYEPPLSLIDAWRDRALGIGVKVAPGIDYAPWQSACEVEIVSLAGDVKEARLWFGALRETPRRATLLPQCVSITFDVVPPVPVLAPRAILYEPDGAVIRAHLIEQLAAQLNAAQIDPTIAFLTGDDLIETPFARAFAVRETLPFNLKKLRARLRELRIGRVVVKKRGSPIDPQVLEQQLRLDPSLPEAITLVLTRVLDQPSVILCDPIRA